MKILFNNHMPFSLAHGGAQIQIEQTKAGLERIGVTVEPLRWWDENQKGDVLHHFGRMPLDLLRVAKQKGMKAVFSDFLTETGSRSPMRLRLQKLGERGFRYVLPRPTIGALSWDSYREADACIAVTSWEAHLMKDLFRAPAERVHVIPNGVEDVFFDSDPQTREKWLVCTATITERKRVLELAEAAVLAQTPVWIIGKPYSDSAPYARRFLEIARQHPEMVRYEGPISDRAKMASIYRSARGFVLLSTIESLSLSSVEAAACGCPMLLADLPWARAAFADHATYCPIAGTVRTSKALKEFYAVAPTLKPPPRPLTWVEVGRQLETIYKSLLTISR